MPLTSNLDRHLTAETKGMPLLGGVWSADEIPGQGWNVLHEDLNLPVAVLRASAVEQNSKWMREYLSSDKVLFAPHGKTSMSPELFSLQLDMGAWAITLATAHQVAVARRFGIQRIFLANQLVGRQAIAYVLSELKRDPDFDFYCLVDDIDQAASLADAVRQIDMDRPLQVLIEVGYQGGRTGVRTNDEAQELARFVSVSPYLALRGIEGFEGLIAKTSHASREDNVREFLARMVSLVQWCDKHSLFEPEDILLSAGGSSFYDIVLREFRDVSLSLPYRVVTRSGCYIAHDAILYKKAFERIQERSPDAQAVPGGLTPALEVWGYVQSRPEPGRLIVNAGKRDLGHDDFPLLQRWYRPGTTTGDEHAIKEFEFKHVVVQLDDQHCHVSVPENSPLQVGDMVQFGISHPCLTFDKWRNIFVVDDHYNITGSIETFF